MRLHCATIALLLIGFIVARILSKLVLRVLHELEMNRILKEQANVTLPVEEFLTLLATKYPVPIFASLLHALRLPKDTTERN